jgi:hypothetical protein
MSWASVPSATPVARDARAKARLSTPEDRSVVRRIATRYLGPEAGEQYAETAGDDLLIRLEPGELRAWDFADYFARASRPSSGCRHGQRAGMSPEEGGTELVGTECPTVRGTGGKRLTRHPLDVSLWHDAWSWMRVGSRDF